MHSQTRHIQRFMRQGDAVTALLDSLNQRNALLDQLRPLLPEALARHCLQANLDKEDLVLSTDTAAWAAALRFQGPELIQRLAGQGIQVKRCRIRVLPGAAAIEFRNAKTTDGAARTLHAHRSQKGANFIGEAADNVTDPGLADSLRRLARTLSSEEDLAE